LNLSTFRENNK